MGTFGTFMSYCRQSGAKRAMAEALEQVEECINDGDTLSEDEAKAFRNYIINTYYWMSDMCLVNLESELNEDELDNMYNMLVVGPKEGEEDE